ncbi:MAG: N-formylglutamate amidohydrolase [Deltaproteobacteria bacterium]|nr:N-formylglutamate amidohydrolase [Deltaproteobacteria bacterium]
MEWPFVISLPHSSGRIPESLLRTYALSEKEIRESTDLGTQEIFGDLPAISVLGTEWSRLVIDLNRGPRERGPKGLIAQVDYNGRAVYHPGCIPDGEELEARLKAYYWPFHHRFEEVLDRGVGILFDCHSLGGVGPPEAPDPGRIRKDIILGNNGNRRGETDPVLGKTTCPGDKLFLMKEAFEKQGFSVSINDPYAGGYIVNHYGQKYTHTGLMAVQIEINQDMFMEGTDLVAERVEQVRERIRGSFDMIAGSI